MIITNRFNVCDLKKRLFRTISFVSVFVRLFEVDLVNYCFAKSDDDSLAEGVQVSYIDI